MNLRCSPHILWLQDADQILLIHSQDHRSWILREEKAFIWDMLCQHHKTDLLLEMFARIYPDHDAQSYFNDLVLEWRAMGILMTEETARAGRTTINENLWGDLENRLGDLQNRPTFTKGNGRDQLSHK